MLLCVVLDCTGMRLGVTPSSLSDVSLLLSVEFDGKKEEDLFGRLFTAKKKKKKSTSKIKSKRLSYSQEFRYFQHSKSLTEQYSPVVLFIMLYNVVLTFDYEQ